MHSNITLIVRPDYAAMSLAAADCFARCLAAEPDGVFGFATGGTPVGMYAELVRLHREARLDFSRLTAFNLDEYFPIRRDDPQSYFYFMRQNLFNHVNVRPEALHIPNGEAADPDAECAAYDRAVEAAGGIGFQILGIGANGHIGFNEPAESFTGTTHCVGLSEVTVASNARFFDSEALVPRHALTMGVRPILLARRILLLANGEGKAAILRDALCGPITPLVPASALQLHPCVTVVTDEAAAALL